MKNGEDMVQDGAKTIARQDVGKWVAKLMERAEVITPVAGHGGDVMYSRVSSPDDVMFDFANTLLPPKQFVLPQTDPLVRIRRDAGGFKVEPAYDERRRVLFNVRSCDARSISFLTKMHTMDLVDDVFRKRAENVTVVSLTCNIPCPLGFCTCTDSGPFLKDGYDVQLTLLPDRILVETGSEKGVALVAQGGDLMRPAAGTDVDQRKLLEEVARGSMGKETCHFASAMRRVSTGRVEEDLWVRMSDWCVECGGCNLVCPTCYCFSVKDLRDGDGWLRCRTWDSCQYAAFTMEASGHNPRERRKDRMKRRFFHKVSAQYFQRDGMVGCVGCGRCVKVCLGTTDVPAVVGAIRKGAWNG